MAQEIAAVLHADDAGQLTPAVQLSQLPAAHTWLVPQVVPLGSRTPESAQTGVPVPQWVTPTRHGDPGIAQVMPSLQVTQLPAAHIWPLPQLVPSATSVSLQSGAPPAQLTAPERHGPDGWQLAPSAQATQAP